VRFNAIKFPITLVAIESPDLLFGMT
jgi:hypothetical protein